MQSKSLISVPPHKMCSLLSDGDEQVSIDVRPLFTCFRRIKSCTFCRRKIKLQMSFSLHLRPRNFKHILQKRNLISESETAQNANVKGSF